jgi:hypothetical protein
MYEDFETIFSRGLQTWARNLNICIPFLLSSVLEFILYILFFGVIGFYVYTSNSASIIDPSSLSDTEIISMLWKGLKENVLLFAVLTIVFFLFGIFLQSFFTAGAIGMAKKAIETGDTVLSDMLISGSKNMFRLFLTVLLISLLVLAGIVFVVPGALTIGDLSILIKDPEASVQGASLLLIGVVLWLIYIIFLSIVLSLASYALVIDELEPLEALRESFRFFKQNKLDVFLLWILFVGMTFINSAVENYYGTESILIAGLTAFLPMIVIQPVITILSTRLYASRKGKKLYNPVDLLSVPD